MTKNGTSEFSAPFDDMLAANRKDFDDLYGGPAPRPQAAQAAQPAQPAAKPAATPARTAPATTSRAAVSAPAGATVDGIAFTFRP